MNELLDPPPPLFSCFLVLIPCNVQLLLPLLLGYLEIPPGSPALIKDNDLLTLDILLIFSSIDSLLLFDFFKYGL
jgi:hypothetical protein